MTTTPDGMARTAVPGDRTADAAERLENLRRSLDPMTPQERLTWAVETYGQAFALTTSFGIQSAVLLHMLSRIPDGDSIPVIWVDTGYLPPETYHYVETLRDLLGIRLVVVQSEMSPARMEAVHGKLWETGELSDLELYHRIRKVEPLEQAFASLETQCWASGVRRRQTDHRSSMTWIDPIRNRLALHPLLLWTNREIFYYMQDNALPQQPLFDQGYSTVGDWHSSGPDGSDQSGRSTRFGGLKQECGIHVQEQTGEGMMGDGI